MRRSFALIGRMLLVILLVSVLGTGVWMLSRLSRAADLPIASSGDGFAERLVTPVRLPELAVPRAVALPPESQQPSASVRADGWAAQLAPQVGIPPSALAAYGMADLGMRDRAPACQLSWATLAGIGRVRSHHGARVLPTGPMGLTPAQWDRWQVDADGIGPADPQNINDAAQAVAGYLCDGGRDLSAMPVWWSAIRSLVAGDGATVQKILSAMAIYAASSRGGDGPSPAARQALDFALDQIGLPYLWGGNGPERGDRGFDCSGLTTAAYAAAGVALPRTADSQYRSIPLNPPKEQPRPGDLVFYGNPAGRIHHVGLYLGGGLMINAPTFGYPVQINAVGRYTGSGRPS